MDTAIYKQLRHQLRTGDLIGAHSDTLGGRIIQLVTGGWFTHVAMVLIDEEFKAEEEERVLIGQADRASGVHLEALSHYLEQLNGQAVWFPLRHEWAKAVNPDYQHDLRRAIKRDIGRKIKYDLRGAARFLLPFVGQNEQAMFCSETIGQWDQRAKLWDVLWPDPSRLSPTDAVQLPLVERSVPLFA